VAEPLKRGCALRVLVECAEASRHSEPVRMASRASLRSIRKLIEPEPVGGGEIGRGGRRSVMRPPVTAVEGRPYRKRDGW